jgi:thiamine kinase-like enzyme
MPIHIDTTATPERYHAQIKEVIQALCPFLLTTSSSKSSSSLSVDTSKAALSIRPLTGGLSNHLFLVSGISSCISNNNNDDDDTPTTVLVRVHPETTGHDDNAVSSESQPTSSTHSFSIINRELENRFAAWLATQNSSHSNNNNDNNNNSTNQNHKLAPTVYGRFDNGRVEEFYNHVRPLSCPEMKLYAKYIAPQMAFFHQLPDPTCNVLPRPQTEPATLYETIELWLQQVEYLLHQDEKKNDDDVVAGVERTLFDRLTKEWRWVKEQLSTPSMCTSNDDDDDHTIIACQAYRFIRRIAVTHMDCQPLNILIPTGPTLSASSTSSTTTTTTTTDSNINLRLIDFEYSGWNPVAADIANTFCEYCEMSNLRADYAGEYPSEEQQEEFFWYYCHAYPREQYKFVPQHRDSEEWKVFSKALQHEVGRFSLLSHLGWAVWSIIKSKEDDGVDFDYIFYAHHRMEGYDWAKTKFFG